MTRATFKLATLPLLSGCLFTSLPLLADRPAVDESRPAEIPVYQAPVPEPTVNSEESPSAVELMMQQESGTILKQLPAKELQPGETLSIKTLDQPRRGASMEKVRNELGAPVTETPAVGQPPITKWIYNDRVVVFEYSKVIHVVAK